MPRTILALTILVALVAAPGAAAQPSTGNGSATCVLTGLPPAVPSTAMLRCPTRNATCCSTCQDVQLSLAAATADFSGVASFFVSFLGNLFSGLQFCSLFGGQDQCQLQLEALLCAVHCDADASAYITKDDDGHWQLNVCQDFAQTLFSNCHINIPGLGFINALFPSVQSWLTSVFGVFLRSVGMTDFKVVVGGAGSCFSGPTVLPSVPLCCDSFQSAAQCPTGTVSTDSLSAFQSHLNNGSSSCAQYNSTPPPFLYPPAPVLTVLALPPPSTSSPPSPTSSPQAPPQSPPSSSPPPPAIPPPPSPPPLSSYPLCLLTGALPVRPVGPHFRCPQASAAACCTDCADASASLSLHETRVRQIVQRLAPQLAFLVPDITGCQLFQGYSDCQFNIEAFLCAFTCNPDSGNYFNKTDSGYSFRICQSFASQLFNSCQSLSLNGLSLSLIASSPQSFLSTVVDNVVAGLGYSSFNTTIAQSACYAGPDLKPSAPFCCDDFAAVSHCPVGSVNTTEYGSVIGQPVNSNQCSGFNQPTSATPPPAPPPQAQANPPTMAPPSPGISPPSRNFSLSPPSISPPPPRHHPPTMDSPSPPAPTPAAPSPGPAATPAAAPALSPPAGSNRTPSSVDLNVVQSPKATTSNARPALAVLVFVMAWMTLL